ncbi:MAG TPA: lysophospholipid acyltransferase family protein [Ktedonobacterales bacterium]
MKYWLFRVGLAVIPHLPQRLAQQGALAAGWLLWILLPGPRRQVSENLRHVPRLAADPPVLRRAVRNVFGNSILNYVDFFRLSTVSAAELADYWEVSGLEHLDAALAKGRGCILISGHLGNFDYAMRHFINLGYTITVTQERLKPERLHELVMQARSTPGVHWAPVDSASGLRQLFSALRRNEVVIMPADRDIQGHGEIVPLFGAPARLPPGGVQLAQRTGAALLGVFPHRKGLAHGHGEVVPLPVLTAEEEAAEPDPLRQNLHRAAKLLEQQIERNPEQWVVFQPIWLAEPAAAPIGPDGADTLSLQQPESAAPQHNENLQTHHVS